MTIQPATAADLSALLPLWHEMMAEHAGLEDIYTPRPDAGELVLQHFRKLCHADDRLILVAREQSIAGYLSASIRSAPPVFAASPVGVINELVVTATLRGQGIGRQLYQHARMWLRERGIERVEVRTLARNRQSNGFWAKLGFEPYATEFKAAIES